MPSIFDILKRKGNLKNGADKYHPAFIDVTEWQEVQEFQTGGTREKCWLINPDTFTYYFFKVSIKKGDKDYPSEFWMEIIASKVGMSLGLDMLNYDIAKQDEKVGCISKNMVAEDEGYALVELMYILAGYCADYNPEKDKDKFTIDFVYNALQSVGLERYIDKFIDVLIFDCVIGNQDRHQENWGFISPQEAKEHISDKNIKAGNIKLYWAGSKVAPIYDSGSSLGRENNEEKVNTMLKDHIQMEAYINRYKPEIRIEQGSKISYVEMINYLLQHPTYGRLTHDSIERIVSKYNPDISRDIIMGIDTNLPKELSERYGLSKSRKLFVIDLIDRRIKRLKQFL